MTDTWTCRELRANDTNAIANLLRGCPPEARLFVRKGAPDWSVGDGWWYGAVAAGAAERGAAELGAALQVEGTTGTLIEGAPAATVALAHTLLAHQRLIGKATGDRHVLRGLQAPMGRLWEAFQQLGRKVVADRTRALFSAPGEAQASRLDVRAGEVGDLKLVSEFIGESVLESRGFDPRRTGRDAHERRCQNALREGRCLVARDGGAAVLVAELAALDEATWLLEPWFVPRAFRSRKRLVAQALLPLPGLPMVAGRQLLAFAEGAELNEAFELAGWQQRAVYRVVEMQG